MTHFNIEQTTDLPDRIYVEIGRRFNIAIERTGHGLKLSVYPRTAGELWDHSFVTFEVDGSEVGALEAELHDRCA